MSLPISYPQPPTIIPAVGLNNGTVTSVGVTAPPEFTVANSPVTATGTIALNKATQAANNIWAGPAAGPAAQPAFRPLALADMPPGLPAGTVTSVGLAMPGEYAVANSPVTNANTLTVTKTNQPPNQVYAGPVAGPNAQPSFRALATADLPAGTGTVTSVGLTMPAEYAVANSPVTGANTLAVTKTNQSANQVYAGPAAGAPAQPVFRALAAADLPAGTGTVTSVGLTMPGEFAVANSPVTGANTLAVTKTAQPPSTVWAAPTTLGGIPVFRLLNAADLPAYTLEDILNNGPETGPYNIYVTSPAIEFQNGINLQISGFSNTVGDSTNVTIGYAVIATGLNATAVGRLAEATQPHATALGPVAHAYHQFSTALGYSAETTAANQLRLGTATETVSIPGNLIVDQYIRSLQQKACVAGITPGTSALQALPVAATTTLDIKDTLFDPLAMVNLATDRISLTDTQQCWGVSVMVRGDFGGLNPATNTWTMQLIWFDGAVDRIIGEHQLATVANVNAWSTTLATGMRTNANAGQYLYCRITNNTPQIMKLTHFRFSVTRVA